MRRWQFRDQTLPLSLLGLTDAGLDDIFTAVTLLYCTRISGHKVGVKRLV
jgi:hypothetical protein